MIFSEICPAMFSYEIPLKILLSVPVLYLKEKHVT